MRSYLDLSRDEVTHAMALHKARARHRIVLLCAEKDETQCHRNYIKAKIMEEAGH